MSIVSVVLTLFVLTLTAFAQEEDHSQHIAPIVNNNPQSTAFQALLQYGRPVQGLVIAVSSENGTGVNFSINLFDFPSAEDGPFKYHIHEFPLDTEGNCTSAGGHLTPYGRQDTPPCDNTVQETCQPGDLSGKHGGISDTADGNTFQATFLDLYLSTDPNSVSFFGNRSIVVHANNGTRLNCGNFTQQVADSGGGQGGDSAGNGSRPNGNGPESYNPVNGGNGGGGNHTGPTLATPTAGATRLSLLSCLACMTPVILPLLLWSLDDMF
ncbi:hypothetical protein PV10_08212 [Exophiala mesophila]|uniref:superoxide dismutase n=1 Tax=Exophiala mesophila TaxID=212818 RepID=A0A0D1XK29_EXOME|nr:uncharacterized protein PV10_08212 [Exophiala mesophila]KIV88536.1 hypothetical protein PV10_08212 [Exophiala mesophila]